MNSRRLTDDEIEQRTADFIPTPAEIAQSAAAIRAGWSIREEKKRRGERYDDDAGLDVQTVREGVSDDE